MRNLFIKTQMWGKEKVDNKKLKATNFIKRQQEILADTSGEGYLDTVIKLLIAVVLGALLLAGLYALFNNVVMPRLETEVTDMFNYDGR